MVSLTKSKLFSLIAACVPAAALTVVAFLVTIILWPAGSHAFVTADYQLSLRPQAYYVGNTEVDLAFRVLGPPSGTTRTVELSRDGILIASWDIQGDPGMPQDIVFNDSGLSRLATHTYKNTRTDVWEDIDGNPQEEIVEEQSYPVNIGRIGGIITRDTVWDGGVWSLDPDYPHMTLYPYDSVFAIEEGASLSIAPLTTVEVPEGNGHWWMVLGSLSADQAVFDTKGATWDDFLIGAIDDHGAGPATPKEFSDSSVSMTECTVLGPLRVEARNSPVFENNNVSGELKVIFRHLSAAPVNFTGLVHPRASLFIEDGTDITIVNNILHSIEIGGSSLLNGGKIHIGGNQLVSKSRNYGSECHIKVHELGSSDLLVEGNSFDPDIRGYLSLSHFTSEGQIGERRVTANRGMREILLADVSDAADSGVHHTVIKDNHVVDDLYNDGIGIRLDRGTHNTISGNTIIHPPDMSDGFPGAGIGLGFATTLDRLEVSENTIEKNIVNNFVMGIMLDWTTQNIVSQNSLYGNANGMWLNSTTANTITANTFRYNVYNMSVGRYANAGDRPENNVIYDNLFGLVSGYTNVEFIGFSYKPNVWNVNKSQGPNIVGGPYIGGNYWADVPGVDLDLDGLGDEPYEIVSNNVDNLPLIIQGVNSIGDASDRDPADGICDTGATILRDSTSEPECTLRAAIEQANAREGRDRVFFNIPGTTTPVITPMHALPSITDTVIIDGTTQPGSGRVKVSGTGAGAANGLDCEASDLVVLVGLDIEGFAGHGVFFNPGGATNLSVIDSAIRGNRGWGLYQASERGFEPLIARDSVISGNLQGGMYLWTGLARGSRNLTIVENGFWGIFNHGKGLSGDIELEASRIIGNGGDGIHSWSSWARVIAGGYPDSPMIISGNAGDGIESGGSVMVDHAVIEENGRYGIKADGEDGVIAMDTRIAVNGAGGILAEEGISLAERLTVSDNNGHGIHARGTGNRRGPGSAGMLGQATIAGNSGDGIRSESGELLLTDSRIFANGQTGVRSFDGLYAKNLLVLGNGRDGLYIGGDVQLDRGESCRNAGTDLFIGGLSTVSRFTSGDTCRVTDFTADPLLGTAPVSVSFTSAAGENHSPLGEPAANEDSTDNEVFTTRWDFGDGSTSSLTNPDHTYTEPGSYTVSLTQMLGDGLSRTEFKTDHVVVEAACTTDADCDDGLWCNGVESCDNGYCRQASPVCGEDGLYCNGLSWCDEEGDQCMTTPAPCLASGAFCNEETDSCTLATDLQAVFIHLGLLAGKTYCNPDLQMQDRTGDGRAGLAEAIDILHDLAD